MDIYDPISLALGIPPIEYDHNTDIPEDAELVGFGGNNKGEKRPGIGGAPKGRAPWNKGLSKDDPRVAKNGIKAAATKKANGFYEKCGVYLPKKFGDKNHMKTPEHKARMSALAKSRFRLYNEDGTWTWGYKD